MGLSRGLLTFWKQRLFEPRIILHPLSTLLLCALVWSSLCLCFYSWGKCFELSNLFSSLWLSSQVCFLSPCGILLALLGAVRLFMLLRCWSGLLPGAWDT